MADSRLTVDPLLDPQRPTFFFDFACPYAYLAAERIAANPEFAAVWRLAALDQVLAAAGRTSWLVADAAARVRHVNEIERRARELQLLPLHWPPLPLDSRRALLAAAYAQATGRLVAFSLAAFRHAYAAGRDLANDDALVIAAAACELHPRALLKGIELASTRELLDASTQAALRAGVRRLPAVVWRGHVFEGDDRIAELCR